MHTDRAYLVLGGSGAIGGSLARELAAGGAQVMVAGRDRDRTEGVAEEIGGAAFVYESATVDSVQAAVEDAQGRFGKLDGIANCVGSILLKPAHITSPDEWDSVIATNLGSAFAAVRAGAKAWAKGGGSIVLVSSAAATLGLANHEAIAAAKAGIIGLAKSAAATYARKGIRVNVVAPGLVRSGMTERIVGNAAAAQASTDLHPLGRLGEPEDVASALAWFLDQRQSWVTGQVLGVDGGLGGLKTRPA